MYDELIKRLRRCASYDPRFVIQDCEDAADAIEELIKAVLRLEDESGIYDELPIFYIYPTKWIPVTERLPEKDGRYLTVHTLNSIPPQPWIEVCWFAKDLYKVDKYDFHDKKKKSGFYQYDSEWGNFERTGISHWMPLPQPPEDE